MTDQTMETVTQQQETVTKLVEYNRRKKEELKLLNGRLQNKMI